MTVENYGNDREYIMAWLRRDGFDRLAESVRSRRPSARFAKELAITVPREHLDAVTDRAENFGRRPQWWDWQFALTLSPTGEIQPDNCQVDQDVRAC
jgi:hypothetical protein